MSWLSRVFSSNRGKQPSDPILKECAAIARKYVLSLDEEERKRLLVERDKLAQSALGGGWVQRDVFQVLCHLCLFDTFCQTGVEFLQNAAYDKAVRTLSKAKILLPWPSVLYSLMLAHKGLGQQNAAKELGRAALDGFESRSRILAAIVPESLPHRDLCWFSLKWKEGALR